MKLNNLKDKTVLITGDSGFKGSWLSLYLLECDCRVSGYSINEHFGLQDALGVLRHERFTQHICDILDEQTLHSIVERVQPDIIFHFAAQSLVGSSYNNPKDTWNVNLVGTLNLLRALERMEKQASVIIATTDKVYSNQDVEHSNEGHIHFSETSPLGGQDPYSASKAAVEILVESWQYSFSDKLHKIATVRAGNVFGGGDFTPGRLVPDLVRSIQRREPLELRNPSFIRPWQNVNDVIIGYLLLADKLNGQDGEVFCKPYNLGPSGDAVFTVQDIVQKCFSISDEISVHTNDDKNFGEAPAILLNANRALKELGWENKSSLDHGLSRALEWYEAYYSGKIDMYQFSIDMVRESLSAYE